MHNDLRTDPYARKDAANPNLMHTSRRSFLKTSAATGLGLPAVLRAQADARSPQTKDLKMEIKRSGSQPSGKGPADWFTGTVRIDPLFRANAPARTAGASVTFEPGARIAWHTHPRRFERHWSRDGIGVRARRRQRGGRRHCRSGQPRGGSSDPGQDGGLIRSIYSEP